MASRQSSFTSKVSKRWVDDSEVEACPICTNRFDGSVFDLTLSGRTHCRYCGGVFCTNCCSTELLMPEGEVVRPPRTDSIKNLLFDVSDPQKACNNCAAILEPKQEVLRAKRQQSRRSSSGNPLIAGLVNAASKRSLMGSGSFSLNPTTPSPPEPYYSIRVVAGKDLTNLSRQSGEGGQGDMPNAICQLSVGSSTQVTEAVAGSANPEWGQTLEFGVTGDRGSVLDLKCFDESSRGRELIGRGSLVLGETNSGGIWVKVEEKKVITGEILLQISYKGPRSAPAAAQAPEAASPAPAAKPRPVARALKQPERPPAPAPAPPEEKVEPKPQEPRGGVAEAGGAPGGANAGARADASAGASARADASASGGGRVEPQQVQAVEPPKREEAVPPPRPPSVRGGGMENGGRGRAGAPPNQAGRPPASAPRQAAGTGFLQEYAWIIYIMVLLAIVGFKFLSTRGPVGFQGEPIFFKPGSSINNGKSLTSSSHFLLMQRDGRLVLGTGSPPGDETKTAWVSEKPYEKKDCPKCSATLDKTGSLLIKDGKKVLRTYQVEEVPTLKEAIDTGSK